MTQIFEVIKQIGSFFVNFFKGVLHLGQTTNQLNELVQSWSVYVPTQVFIYIAYAVIVSIILVILGRRTRG